MSPLREPAAETTEYPGMFVHDGRVTGSITLGQSRLPAWAVMAELCESGWAGVRRDWPNIEEANGWEQSRFATFLCDLTESRGEFARLLLVLADCQRRERLRDHRAWWTKRDRKALSVALRRCLACLEAQP